MGPERSAPNGNISPPPTGSLPPPEGSLETRGSPLFAPSISDARVSHLLQHFHAGLITVLMKDDV